MIKNLLVIIMVISLVACSAGEKMTNETAISKIKATACEKADEAGTCFTKLPRLGIISAEECCKEMGKCCGDSG